MVDINRAYWAERVQGPGKFEGEQPETAYFYEICLLNSDGESLVVESDMDYSADLFIVDGEESDAFDLDCGSVFVLVENSDGFVFGRGFSTETEAREWFSEWSA